MRGFLDDICSQVAVTIDDTCSGEKSGPILSLIFCHSIGWQECSKSGAAMALPALQAPTALTNKPYAKKVTLTSLLMLATNSHFLN